MNSLIRAIKRNTAERKKIKKRIDSELNLSVENEEDVEMVMLSANSGDNKNRLIDEGAIIEGDGSVWGYLKKGTVEKFLNGENEYLGNLPVDFVGNINIGHLDHATFPFPVGEWRFEDMTMVDIGDGRKGIDMNTATIDDESIFIKELKRLGYDLSMSIEAYFHTDYDASEDLGFPVFDEMLITGYAVCGDGKNVGSNGMKLKGEPMEDMKDIITEETLDEEKLGAEEAEIPATTETEPTAEETSAVEEAEDNEPAEDEAEDEAEEAEEESEGSEEDEVEETAEDGDEDDVDEAEDTDEEELSIVESLREQIQTLTNTIAELTEANAKLKKTNRKLSAKYQNELDKKAKFKEDLKGLSVELLPDEDKKEDKEELKVAKRSRNGIGEI